MNSDTIPSLIRTYVPLAVAWAVGWLTTLGITVDAGAQSALASGIGAVVAAVYYAAVRWAEQRWPWVGKFLGSTKQPVYAKADAIPVLIDTEDDNGAIG